MKKNLTYALLACILFADTLAAQPGGEPAAGSKPNNGLKKPARVTRSDEDGLPKNAILSLVNVSAKQWLE